MNLTQLMQVGLNHAKSINSGTLVCNGISITVYKSFLKTQSREMQEVGYNNSYDDLYVLASPTDVVGMNLIPNQTEVTLDGVGYVVGRTVTTTPGYVSIWLRLKQ